MKSGEIESLTGLRGVAALCVVIGHFSLWTLVAPRAEVPSWVLSGAGALPGIGMSIFFTLSGFVIALSYSHWDWRDRPGFNLVRLFFYRFARLYPAFLLFAVMIVLRSPQLRDFSNPEVPHVLTMHLLLWQSWLPERYLGQGASSDPFHVSWSISTECGLYLLFGLAAITVTMLPTWRNKAAIVAGSLSAIVLAMLLAAWLFRQDLKPADYTDPQWSSWLFYLSPWGISVQFGLGVLAYRLMEAGLSAGIDLGASYAGAACLIVVYLLCATGGITSQVPQGLASAIGTALLMAGARSPSLVNRLLSRPAILYVGTVSYSLYLFHFVVPQIAFNGNFATFDLTTAAYWAANFLFSVAMAIMLATGIFRLVEEPGRRIVRRAADKLLGVQREVISPLQARALRRRP
jgi:peptidoglycan/LPS O-acetylase OafA/YrhL